MEVSLQEATAAISLQSIQAIKKEQEKSIAKALSILPRGKDGKNIPDNIPPSKERHDNFQLQAFQCLYSSCLSANEAEARLN